MTPTERLSETIKTNDAIRLAIAGLMLDSMGDDEAWFDLSEEACVATFGPRVDCPHCGASTGVTVFPGLNCYECEEPVTP